MSELRDPLLAELDEHGEDAATRFARSWKPQPWWAWTLALLALGAAALLVAGGLLSSADFGTSLRARTCDTSPVAGLLLLAAGGACLMLGMQLARLRWEESFLVWDAGSLVLTLPIPVALLAATLPGVLGCAAGREIARLGVLGDALVGTPGIALAAAASALVGVALGGVAHVGWTLLDHAAAPAPGIVELAIAEAEALQTDQAATRFHGVESGE